MRRFWGTFWVDATDKESWCQSYIEIARQGRLANTVDSGKSRLAWKPNWLLIIDNASNANADVSKIFPGGVYGSILVTTRNPECGVYSSSPEMNHKLEDLELHESVELLLGRSLRDKETQENRAHAELIVKQLQYLPLAIVQAAAAIRENECKLTDYLHRFEHDHRELLSRKPRQGVDQYEYTVYTTWELSLKMMEEKDPEDTKEIEQLLSMLAYLYYDRVPVSVLEHVSKHEPPNLWRKAMQSLPLSTTFRLFRRQNEAPRTTPRTRVKLNRMLSLLSCYSLIDMDNTKDELSLHKLVQSWIHHRMGLPEQIWAQKEALEALGASIRVGDSASEHELRRRLFPHVHWLIYSIKHYSLFEVLRYSRPMMGRFAQVIFEGGDFPSSHGLYQEYWRYLKALLGSQHEQTLAVIHQLSLVYESQGLYNEAEKYAKEAFEGRLRTLGESSVETWSSMASLAMALSGQASYSQAQRISETILSKLNKLGKQEVVLRLEVKVMETLALALQHQGKYDNAAKIALDALSKWDLGLGEPHPDTLDILSTLALTMEKQDRWEEAKVLATDALLKREQYLGKAHPNTLTSAARLGVILGRQGQHTEAKKRLTEVLNMRKNVLGEEHPDTLTSHSQLGQILLHYDDYGEAEGHLREAMEGFQRNMTPDHNYIRVCQTNLGVCLNKQGRYQEAESLYRDVLFGYGESDSKRHPDALTVRANLALTLQKQKKMEEAEQIARDCLKDCEEFRGPHEVETFRNLDHLGWILVKGRKRFEEAEELIGRAVKGLVSKLGTTDPDTLNASSHLAHVLHCRKKYHEAWRVYKRTCDGFESQGSQRHWCFENFENLKASMEKKGIPAPTEVSTAEVYHSVSIGTITEGRSTTDATPKLPDSRSHKRTSHIDLQDDIVRDGKRRKVNEGFTV